MKTISSTIFENPEKDNLRASCSAEDTHRQLWHLIKIYNLTLTPTKFESDGVFSLNVFKRLKN